MTVAAGATRSAKSLMAAALVAAAALLVFAALASATCVSEQSAHCGSVTATLKGHQKTAAGIVYGLNGRPNCRHARGLVSNWLRRPFGRIYDSSFRGYWFEVERDPYIFAAGLCGVLTFRVG